MSRCGTVSCLVLAVIVAGAPPLAAAEGGELNLWPPDWPVLGLNLLVLAALIYPTHRLLLAPLLAILDERERRTGGASSRAAGLAEEARRAREELESHLQEARAAAQARRASIMAGAAAEERAALDQARAEGARTVAELRASIAGELDEARRRLAEDAELLAREAAARVLGRSV